MKHFKEQLSAKAKTMKKTADRGLEQTDADMVEDGDDSSGFEDCDSNEDDDETQEDAKKAKKKSV